MTKLSSVLCGLSFTLLLLAADVAGADAVHQNMKNPNDKMHDEKGNPVLSASKSSSRNDFDFLQGEWIIRNRKLKSRLSGSSEWVEFEAHHEMGKILEGVGNMETITAAVDGRPFEGRAVRLFEPGTRLWRIYWVDNTSSEMGDAVVGSFENGVGTFFGREIIGGKDIAVQFRWDATDPEKPVWSQAFSADGGKTWEWNWYMYFERRGTSRSSSIAIDDLNLNRNIKVIELRNYLVRRGRRDEFIDLFEENFTRSQNVLGGYTLGQYRVKSADDNFFWIRGFTDMPARNKFLNEFYYCSPSWKVNKAAANSMLLNNDNVHLLRPAFPRADNAEMGFDSNWFGRKKGVAVIDFYTSNTKLEKLIAFVRNKYSALFSKTKAANTSFWVSETTPNDFPGLPVFQDKNLLVQITFYKTELEYQSEMKTEDSKMNDELSTEMHDLVTINNTLIVYPTAKSFSTPAKGKSDTHLN